MELKNILGATFGAMMLAAVSNASAFDFGSIGKVLGGADQAKQAMDTASNPSAENLLGNAQGAEQAKNVAQLKEMTEAKDAAAVADAAATAQNADDTANTVKGLMGMFK